GFTPRIRRPTPWIRHEPSREARTRRRRSLTNPHQESIRSFRLRMPEGNTAPILQTQGLTKEFGGFVAVKNVDFSVTRGVIHALIGPNGAGKTTFFNLLTKFLQPTGGRIFYEGRDITRKAPADVARLGLVRSFQISAIFPHMTALEN